MKLIIGVALCLQLCAQMMADDALGPADHVNDDPAPDQQTFCANSDLKLTVDNEYVLYLDGTRVQTGQAGMNSDGSWPSSDTVRIPASARVIGIQGTDVGVVAGILASGPHETTDATWRCTATHHSGWAGVNFDDSHWPHATVIGQHGVAPWGNVEGVSKSAKWIWTPKNVYGADSDKTVYCRKRRACIPKPDTTGDNCVANCCRRKDGDYQHCKRCDVFVTCTNGRLVDTRHCPLLTFWDDHKKRCEWFSTTCVVPFP